MTENRDIIKKNPTTVNALLELLKEIDLEVIEVMKASNFFRLNPYEDSRAILLVNIHENVLMSTFVLSMLAETVNIHNKKDWWSKQLPHLKKQFDADSKFDFDRFVFNRQNKVLNREKDNLLFDTFHEFETKIRNIVRVLGNVPDVAKPNRFLNGTEKLYLIRKSFIENYLKLDADCSMLIELLQEIRNSIHNSGIFYSYSQQDKEIIYKGTTYKFSHGYPINFASWPFTQAIILDLVKVVGKILKHELITEVERIEDPVTKITWEQ
jgi:hypothetical protein